MVPAVPPAYQKLLPAHHHMLQVPPVDPDANLAAAAVAAVPRRVARENIKQLLAKKRETLLVQVRLGLAARHPVTRRLALVGCAIEVICLQQSWHSH